MIPKNQLKHMEWYAGKHRCTQIAQWNGESDEFMYIKHEFDQQFADTAKHPEDDDGFALFKPMKQIKL